MIPWDPFLLHFYRDIYPSHSHFFVMLLYKVSKENMYFPYSRKSYLHLLIIRDSESDIAGKLSLKSLNVLTFFFFRANILTLFMSQSRNRTSTAESWTTSWGAQELDRGGRLSRNMLMGKKLMKWYPVNIGITSLVLRGQLRIMWAGLGLEGTWDTCLNSWKLLSSWTRQW